MSYDLYESFDHFMAMYYANYDEIPNLADLIDHAKIYKSIEDIEAVKDLSDELLLIKKLVRNSVIENILTEYGYGISLEMFKSYIDSILKVLSERLKQEIRDSRGCLEVQ
jgi:hypothetical protein